MSLILALALIVVVFCRFGSEKSKVAAYEYKQSKRDNEIEKWEGLNVDKDLEARLEHCIAEESNYEVVYREVSEVLAGMKHWRYLTDGVFYLNENQIVGAPNYKQAYQLMKRNQGIALDIMLANRGKVSMLASAFGYKAYVNSGNTNLKESHYEYAETILKLLRIRGARVKLYYHSYLGEEAYIWEDSRAHNFHGSVGEVVKEFKRSEVFATPKIPQIG